jgi:hypothetical protein
MGTLMRNKMRLVLDPEFDSLLIQLLNEIRDSQVYEFDYKGKDNKKWISLSSKIGVKAKDIIDNELLYPPSTNRCKKLGFISRPKDVEIRIEPFGNKKEISFTRKIF